MITRRFRFVVSCFIVVLVSCWVSRAEVCHTAKTATAQEIAAADAELVPLNDQAGTAAAIKTHLPWGAPKNPASAVHEHMVVQKDYVTDYDDDLRISIWEGHRLTATDVKTVLKRTEAFRTDPRLADAVTATCDDYKNSGYDRGHMAPSGDFTRSLNAMLNSFLLSNMTPQKGELNRGYWQQFETQVRNWAKEFGTVWVITGTVFDYDGDGHRDTDASVPKVKDRVGVPSAYYKIITRKPAFGRIQAIAILIPHEKCGTEDCATERQQEDFSDYLVAHITTIRSIEGVTGLDFFPKLAISTQNALETNAPTALWN